MADPEPRRRWWQRLDPFERVFLPAFFVAFAGLALLFPYSGDDWAFGRPLTGLAGLLARTTGSNGRYAGNLLATGLMRIGPFSALLVAAGVVACLWLVLDIARNRTRSGYLLAAALFLTMPVELWRQTVVWRTGFSMYVPPTVSMLLFLWFAKRELTASDPKSRGVLFCIGVGTLGLVSALFMEHMTLYLIAAAAAFVVAYRMRFGRHSIPGLTWLLSLAAGAALMFSNPAYQRALSGSSGYQEVRADLSGGALRALLVRVVDQLPGWAVAQNVMVNVTLIALIALLLGLVVVRRRPERAVVSRLASLAVLLVGIAVAIAGGVVPLFGGIETIALFGAVLLVSILAVTDRVDRWTIWVACLSIGVLVAPLALVNPIGARCFYPTYMLMILIVSLLMRTAVAESAPRFEIWASVVFGVILAAALVMDFGMHYAISVAADRRVAEIRSFAAQGGRLYPIRGLPFQDSVHNPNPLTPAFAKNFKVFYGLPADLDLVARSYPRDWRR